MKLIPLIGYKKAYTSCECEHENQMRPNDSRIRHWGMVWWRNAEDRLHTTEMGVITESMPDFCGGFLVYSPRVDTYSEDNGWNDSFHRPGDWSAPDQPINLSKQWKDFDPLLDAIDLAEFTGESEWDEVKVKEYALQCIAVAIVSRCQYTGKRGFVGADYDGGRMSQLWDTMNTMREFTVPSFGTFTCDGTISNTPTSYLNRLYDRSTGTKAYGIRARADEKWFNSNSGNRVHWLTADIMWTDSTSDYEDEPEPNWIECNGCGCDYDTSEYEHCPDCGDYNDSPIARTAYGLGEAAFNVLNGENYTRRARRYIWRNG